MVLRPFSVVVAQTRKRGIGLKGGLPWPRLSADMSRFVALTKTTKSKSMQNAVVMGRNTWDSLPSSFKPLPNRCNVVISSQDYHAKYVYHEGVGVCNDDASSSERLQYSKFRRGCIGDPDSVVGQASATASLTTNTMFDRTSSVI